MPGVTETITRVLYTAETHPQEYCMALNIYHESRSDNLAGQYAVADVVLNRVGDPRYPNTICDVVYQAKLSKRHLQQDPPLKVPLRNKCQFSWYCDGKFDTPPNSDSWYQSQIIAYQIVHLDRMRGITEGATHYHATYVVPGWAHTLDLVGRIGEHVFYRWQ